MIPARRLVRVLIPSRSLVYLRRLLDPVAPGATVRLHSWRHVLRLRVGLP